jgi:hypothetical protein
VMSSGVTTVPWLTSVLTLGINWMFEVLKEHFDYSSRCFFRTGGIPLVDDTAAQCRWVSENSNMQLTALFWLGQKPFR